MNQSHGAPAPTKRIRAGSSVVGAAVGEGVAVSPSASRIGRTGTPSRSISWAVSIRSTTRRPFRLLLFTGKGIRSFSALRTKSSTGTTGIGRGPFPSPEPRDRDLLHELGQRDAVGIAEAEHRVVQLFRKPITREDRSAQVIHVDGLDDGPATSEERHDRQPLDGRGHALEETACSRSRHQPGSEDHDPNPLGLKQPPLGLELGPAVRRCRVRGGGLRRKEHERSDARRAGGLSQAHRSVHVDRASRPLLRHRGARTVGDEVDTVQRLSGGSGSGGCRRSDLQPEPQGGPVQSERVNVRTR